MSYIIENKTPLLQSKLTAKGRELLAKGELNFKYWSLGDSEIDYRYVESVPSGTTLNNHLIVLKPKDFQPNHKTFLEKTSCEILHILTDVNRKILECCVSNESIDRGFFSGDTIESMEFLTGDTYIVNTGTVKLSQFNAASTINIGTVDFNDGDYILFKIAKPQTGAIPIGDTNTAILHLWYKIKKTPLSTIITLDRPLPYFVFLTTMVDVDVQFIIYRGGESIINYYGYNNQSAYWNSETVQFISQCDLSTGDVNILNFNAVWNEDFAGKESNNEGFDFFGSFDYVGQKEYLGYNIDCPEVVDIVDCEDKLLSVDDDYIRGIGIIHFSNLHISNDYGELFHIDHLNNKSLEIFIPTIMYHRRFFVGGSGTGNIMGMKFISSGDLKTVSGTTIEYYDLVEDSNYITGTPIIVGRVFHKLKIVAIHDQELLAALSYKSSRNFTLPKLSGKMVLPSNGQYTGVLPKGKTMYMTYCLESDNGLQYFLPQQKYIKFINNSKIDRDIEFTIEDIGQLAYMRQFEQGGYDGLGFYAHRFKILCQIVNSEGERPAPDNWVSINFTSNLITNVMGYTINPQKLETQIANAIGFILNKQKYNSGVIYSLNGLNIADIGCKDELQFGDERVFFGNLRTSIGACIYRSVFNLSLSANDFKKTSNPTWIEGNNLYFDEIGIYNETQQLVMITKLSRPIKMLPNSQFAIEISLDF